jgi:glycosyltransferase involved in cell wall biosynthesis
VRDALTLADRFAQDRPTTLIAGYGNGLFRAQAERGRFRFVALTEHARPLARFAAVPRLRRWLRQAPPGTVVSLGNFGHPTVLLASLGLSRHARVYRMSNEIASPTKGEGRLRRFWLGALLRDSHRVILVGSAMGRCAQLTPMLADGRAIAIPSGVDVAKARALACAPVPHPWLTDDEVPVVLAIGRLRPQKNLALLVDAVAIARKHCRMRLAIIGAGTEAARAALVERAAGYADDFLLAGETDNVFAWLARASAFALPSRWEGSSLALLEALAVGTPVVASRLAGDAAEVLDDGRYGLMFDGNDAAALAAALLRQVSPDAIRPGERAADYDLTGIVERYADVLDGVAIKADAARRLRPVPGTMPFRASPASRR